MSASRRCRRASRLAAVVLAAPGLALAHGLEADGVPLTPGWRLGAGLSVSVAGADQAWPVARHDGVLLTGQTARDRRDELALDQASLAAGVRLLPWLGAELVASAHDRDAAHLDTARLDARLPWAGGELRARLGRQTVSLGGAMNTAEGFDAYTQAPLARHAALDGRWSDDGLSVQWQQPVERGLQSVELGLWRGASFPGSAQARPAPSLRVGAAWDHWSAQAFGAWLRPQGRGAAALASATSGHSHSVPDCRESLQNLVCFDGHSRVLGGTLALDGLAGDHLTLSLSALGRWDRGTLYSTSASAAERGHSLGLWADAVYTLDARWQVAARAERLVTRHRLEGVNAANLAGAAGLAGAAPVNRLTLAVGLTPAGGAWQPLSLWLEAGTEQTRGQAARPWALLRARWLAPRWLEGAL